MGSTDQGNHRPKYTNSNQHMRTMSGQQSLKAFAHRTREIMDINIIVVKDFNTPESPLEIQKGKPIHRVSVETQES